MRVLIDNVNGFAGASDLSDADVAALYATSRPEWWRANMVSTLDGAVSGASGVSGSINTAADKRGFDALRGWADAVVVGAGTARAEGYRAQSVPIVIVSRRAAVPPTLEGAELGAVVLATVAGAEGLASARESLGHDNVWVSPEADHVDLAALRAFLADRGLRKVLTEGGPSLLADLIAGGLVDELCLSTAPLLVGGDPQRILTGAAVETKARLMMLAEEDDTLLARWFLDLTH